MTATVFDTPTQDMRPPTLEMRGISKTFPGTKALNNVQLKAWGGEIQSLMGENGAGKSTLMKVLSGAYHADAGGQILIDGKVVDITNPHVAREHGISIIYQELSLLPNLSVAENIYFGREPSKGGMIDRRTMKESCRGVLQRLGATFGPETIVATLSIAERQLVEIARALHAESKILVMDEPTTTLSSRETDRLFALMRQLRDEGLAIIYISHRMAEVYELSDRVSVLRDGTYVGTLDKDDISAEKLVKMMVGRDLSTFYKHDHVAKAGRAKGQPMLAVEGDHRRRQAGASLQLHALCRRGARPRRAGRLRPYRTGAADLRRRSQDRRHHQDRRQGSQHPQPQGRARRRHHLPDRGPQAPGPVPGHVGQGQRQFQRDRPGCARRRRAQPAQGGRAGEKLHRRPEDPGRERSIGVGTLSGGNQQKVLLARWLEAKPKVMILDEPTRGVDIGAKAEIYRIIDQLAQNGVAVLVISSELPEIMGICDRILVMREGHIEGEVGGTSGVPVTQEAIMALATGVQL